MCIINDSPSVFNLSLKIQELLVSSPKSKASEMERMDPLTPWGPIDLCHNEISRNVKFKKHCMISRLYRLLDQNTLSELVSGKTCLRNEMHVSLSLIQSREQREAIGRKEEEED